MLKYIIPAAVASFFVCAPASAAPVTNTSGLKLQSTSEIVQAKSRRHVRKHRRAHRHYRHRRAHRRYYPGRRYRHAPHGYRRYSYRPYNWRSRGCIIVGPIWFCP